MVKGWRAEFPVADEVVWLLYFQTVIWIALVWNPWISIIYPLLLYIMFKLIRHKLQTLQKKPLTSTNAEDLGNYIMAFLNISFVVVYATVAMFMSRNLTHMDYKDGSKLKQ